MKVHPFALIAAGLILAFHLSYASAAEGAGAAGGLAANTTDIDQATLDAWLAPYRSWHYQPDPIIASDFKIPGHEKFHNFDVPTVFQLPGQPEKRFMSFIGFDGQGYNSFVVESTDLVHWTNPLLAMGFGPTNEFDNGGCVVGAFLYESYDVKAPRLLKRRDGKYWTLYGCYPRQGGYELRPGYEGVACSDDGLTWRRAKNSPTLAVQDPDCAAWEKDCIYQPWLVEDGGRFYDFYNAANGGTEQTGVAFSKDLLTWTRYASNPVVRNRTDGYDAQFASDPKVFRDGDHWTMFYFGVGHGGAHIMVAFSRDLLHWTAHPEPLYKAGGNPSGLDQQYAHKISLVFNPRNESFYMFYCACGDKGRGIGLIISKPLEAEASTPPATFDSAVAWLQKRSTQMIRDCRRTTKSGIAAFPPQVGGGYEAFWLRDYAYMLEGDRAAFSDQELKDSYRFLLAGQRADGAMVDCIKFDGTPCYMPGYGTIGRNPVADGSQFMVDVAWHTFQKTRDTNLVTETVDALIKGMKTAPLNPATGLVHIKPGPEHDRCPYGFTDAIRKQGDELFCSLLYVQASRQLGDLLDAANRREDAAYWRLKAQELTTKIREVFWDADLGLFRAATVVCNQPDIWGSAFAVYLGIATPDQAQRISRYFKEHYREIVKRGQLRHLPGGMFWEQTIGVKPGTYQNGAYWATPVGWFVYALDLADSGLADQTIVGLVQDFIATGDENECVNDGYKNVSHYVASVALPLGGLRAMQQRREAQSHTGPLKPDAFRHYVESFNQLDRETVTNHIPNAAAWDWVAADVPLFECPDKDLEEVYYFRWWTYRKQIKQTPDGFIITEFLPSVPWSGKHNSINCAAGHHFYEGRWLHNPQYLDDYARFWFRKGGEPRKYSFWAANSLYARGLVLGEFGLPKELLPDLIANYQGWEKDHLDSTGLFWQNDGNDGMEVLIGGSGCRATINSYQVRRRVGYCPDCRAQRPG